MPASSQQAAEPTVVPQLDEANTFGTELAGSLSFDFTNLNLYRYIKEDELMRDVGEERTSWSASEVGPVYSCCIQLTHSA